MANFNVSIERVSFVSFDVEANSMEEAEEKAMQQAYDMNWASEEADYNILDTINTDTNEMKHWLSH